MAEELFLKDSYIKEFNAKVLKVNKNKIILDRTAFFPGGGGLKHDTGYIEEYRVIKVYREEGEIIHELEIENLEIREGDIVKCSIDWERRYKMMRLHTAAHIISGILYSKYKIKITGGDIDIDKARLDLNMEGFDNWKEILVNCINEANKVCEKDIEVKVYFLPREEALKREGVVKLEGKFPPNIEILRIVEIPGIDIQADGAPHVKNVKEVGKIEIIKLESRGKKFKRIYYKVV